MILAIVVESEAVCFYVSSKSETLSQFRQNAKNFHIEFFQCHRFQGQNLNDAYVTTMWIVRRDELL